MCSSDLASPTANPTDNPTVSPTDNPTVSPTDNPTVSPTDNPTVSPTDNPTVSPTDNPTVSPTKNPTVSPTDNPTVSPTKNPTVSPTDSPTVSPTDNPTVSPTKNPTVSPTTSPSTSPTLTPEECIKRTPGFWGTHEEVSENYLPIELCGTSINEFDPVGNCTSLTEAVCIPPGQFKGIENTQLSLVRALAAAKLNIKATKENGGSCYNYVLGEAFSEYANIEDVIAHCETLSCGEVTKSLRGALSACIKEIADFNESKDDVTILPDDFEKLGKANGQKCNDANTNSFSWFPGECASN